MDQPVIDTKALFAPKKGKHATKGQKQIYDENQETVRFYSIMALGSIILKFILAYVFSSPISTFFSLTELLIQASAIGGMYHMARPVMSGESKAVLDGGIDLNLKAGFAEYLKDLIITTALCTCLSSISNIFWCLWLWLPAYFSYKLWMTVAVPYFFQPAPEEPEISDKKKKKMERKMMRAGYRH